MQKKEDIAMKPKILISLLLLLLVAGKISGQNANEPNVRINVNVERDENGNIIRYDSTYIETWSSSDDIPIDIDSLFSSFGFNAIPFGADIFGNPMMPYQDTIWGNFFEPIPMPKTPSDIEKIQRAMEEQMKQMQQMLLAPPLLVPDDEQNNSNIRNMEFDDTQI